MALSDIDKSPLYIDSTNSRVGIGTSSPQRHLHINDPSAVSTKIQITNSATGSGSDGDGFQLGIGNTGQANIEQRENQPLTFSTNNTERLRIDSSGNVGIGTSSPTGAKVHVVGGVKATDLIAHDTTGINLQTSNGTKRLIVDNSGNVGIGDNNPSQKLSVNGHIKVDAGSTGYILGPTGEMLVGEDGTGFFLGTGFGANPNIPFYIGHANTASYNFRMGGSGGGNNVLAIDSSGRVTMPYQPAFRAVLITSTNTAINYMIFESVDYNIGNHYNATTGIFTAPIAGRYMVSVQGFNENNQNSQLYVQVNNVNKSYSLSYAGASGSNQYNMMSQHSVFNLAANDTVRVACAAGELYVAGADSNSFSCYLVG